MEIQARDDDALVAGANLALIGSELVQFGRAERIGPARYRLSRLLRARRGTEWAAATHQPGEDFAIIDPAMTAGLEVPTGISPGGEVRLLATGVGDEAPAETSVIVTGEALRPPSPVHLRAEPIAGGADIAISWVRRSRSGWSWPSGSDTPLGEEREAYRLDLSGPGWSRSLELGSPEHLYSQAAQAADGPGPVTIQVAQLGTHGVSRPASMTIN
jgi:hypothetical protein